MAGTVECLDAKNTEKWIAYHGDAVDIARQLPRECVGFSIYSPPFGSLFVYSDSVADMGNSADDAEFFQHYGFLVEQMARITMPGRLSAVHCSDLPYTKWKDGYIGIKDFPGDVIRLHEKHGFVLHSRVTIWRCPVVEMTRTKALGLLYKQLKKDSTRSRQGLADTLLVFRAPGENKAPVGHQEKEFPVEQWQQWASPVWMDIDQTNTLNVRMAKDNKDEKHLCPLQLDLIDRAIILWSNPGDIVMSPFMGIGSEGVEAMKLRRRFIGVELKKGYWQQACRYLEQAEAEAETLFDRPSAPEEAAA